MRRVRVQVERNTFSWTEVWRIFWKDYRLACEDHATRSRATIGLTWSAVTRQRDRSARSSSSTVVAVNYWCGSFEIMAVATSSRLRSIIRFRVSGYSPFPGVSSLYCFSLSSAFVAETMVHIFATRLTSNVTFDFSSLLSNTSLAIKR